MLIDKQKVTYFESVYVSTAKFQVKISYTAMPELQSHVNTPSDIYIYIFILFFLLVCNLVFAQCSVCAREINSINVLYYIVILNKLYNYSHYFTSR